MRDLAMATDTDISLDELLKFAAKEDGSNYRERNQKASRLIDCYRNDDKFAQACRYFLEVVNTKE
jgi:hypothetical protein